MSKLKIIFCFLTLISFLEIAAQNGSEQLLKVVPPSPNVASLGKYGDVPISLYTGIPNISIPLYEIKDGGLDLPISLSYHAGGIKVEEIASSVGLAWTLNAGGIIGRNVRGLPDDEFNSWQPRPVANTVENIMSSGNIDKVRQLVEDVDKGVRDGEADIYYYNFNQFSGKFFYDQSGIVHTVPSKNLLISPFEKGWKITTEDGTVYTFNKVEEIMSATCSGDQSINSAWFLTSIKSIDAKREITFIYDPVNYTYETLIGQTKYFSTNGSGSLCLPNPLLCRGTQNYHTYRLSQINFSDGYIVFNYNTQRCDLMEDKSLDEMKIYTKSNQLLKGFRFGYSYFGNKNDGCNFYTKDSKRLKLISITEENTITRKPPYAFEYNDSIQLPDRLSYAQDHWGYYNGKINNPDLISTFTTTTLSGSQVTFKGADRKANPSTAQAGILKKIKYPTGGETLFTYESNTVSDNQVESQTTEQLLTFGASNKPAFNLPNPYESNELVIPAQGAQVQFGISGLGYSQWPGCDIVQCFVIKDSNPTPFGQISDSWNGVTTSWPAGTYKLKLVNECDVAAIANFNIIIKAEISIAQTFNTRAVGGLRIKQIEDKPGNGGLSIIKNYRYHPEDDTAHSSGVLINSPDYGYDLGVKRIARDEHGSPQGLPDNCFYKVRQSFSNYPLATTQGSYVGYSHVIVDLGENGESRYSFNTYADMSGQSFPFAPVENYDWTRGFLLQTKEFARKNGTLILAKETIHTPYSTNQLRVYGIKTGRDYYYIDNGEMLPNLQPFPKYSFYPTITEFYTLAETKERIYDQNDPTKFIETVNYNTFSPQHLQLIQSKTVTSKSDQARKEEIITNRKYPFDYTFTNTPSGAEAAGIKNLQDLHAANAVIEEYVIKQNRDTVNNQIYDQRVIAGGITTYKSDKPYPNQYFKLEIGSPVPLSNFDNGSIVSASTFIKNENIDINNSYRSAVIFNSYDEYGNVTTQQKNADVKKSYVWGYNSKYPVAEIVGADYADIMARSNLDQTVLQNFSTTDEDMRIELNKIRTNLPSALVTTYTYKPLVGISSQTDVNNRTTYYEYDGFGRLSLIRDQDRNILKKFCYNYQGQTESCYTGIGNAAKTVVFTKSCIVGERGSQVNYTVEANTYFGTTQLEADALAKADIDAKGQTYANDHGTCAAVAPQTYYSAPIDRPYYTQSCSADQAPLAYLVHISPGTYSSIISQADADQLAEQAAQLQANINGACSTNTSNVYARLEMTLSYTDNTSTYNSSDNTTAFNYYQQVSLYLRFYADEACKQPLFLSNNISYSIESYGWMETEQGINYNNGNNTVFQGAALSGSNEVFVDDIMPFEGFWGLYDESGYIYYEKWKYDYKISALGGGTIIRSSISPKHSQGF